MSEDNIDKAVKIAVRERPSKNDDSILYYNASSKNVLIASDRPFAFDYVLKSNVLQNEVFDLLAKPLVVKTLQGYNCNIFAYGQTGTGKTYTMGLTQNLQNECAGIIPRCLNEIFSIEIMSERKVFVSYIEIYNEKAFDMLSSDPGEQVNIKGCKFNGGQKKEINTAEEGFNYLLQGNRNRHVRPTKMNAQSSRSHAIFTIQIKRKSETNSFVSVLNLVDLAGSEGVRRTGHQGIALSEGVNINQGLLSIGKVIQALNAENKVIPYRDSILTSVLQDSLNLNSYLTLLACISSERIDKSETMSTLRFAQSTQFLQSNPHINSVLSEYKKQKQKTPSKLRTPLRMKNIFTPSAKTNYFKPISSLKKFNSFCSPSNVRKIAARKLNNTEIKKNRHPSLMNEINVQDCQNLKRNLESKVSMESSLTSLLNASSSTVLESATIELDNSFEPIKAAQENSSNENIMRKEATGSIKVSINSNSIWNLMKGDLRDIIRDELTNLRENKESGSQIIESKNNSEKKVPNSKLFAEDFFKRSNPIQASDRSISETSNSTWASLKNNIRDIVKEEILTLGGNKTIRKNIEDKNNSDIEQQDSISENNFSFKVPEFLSGFKEGDVKSSSTFNISQESTETTISQPRRSKRLSKMFTKENDNSEHKKLRRSFRLETLHSSTHEASKLNRIKTEKSKDKPLKIKEKSVIGAKLVTTNKIISSYFNRSNLNKNSNSSKTKHQKAVLDLLNNGTIKELQILPHIGLKTAYQIIINRTLNGKFKNYDAVSKLPVWRGKAWERFKEANNII